MPDLSFSITGAEAVPYAVSPQLALKLQIDNADREQRIQSVLLQCQIQIEATRRRYEANEKSGLLDLFGEPHRWGQTLRGMLWTQVAVNVRPFQGATKVDIPVACTFDFNVAATKYFHALEGGEVPLVSLFSGTIFYHDAQSGLQVAQIPWEKEARYRLPVDVWKRVIDHYYPNTAWVTLRRDVFDRLRDFKSRESIPTFEQAVERLLSGVGEGVAR
ncbi:MAG TPA: DUF6084 family protein [Bryobacteraceae bacterium]|nr:DUF6084 family protein [Bryobacteraceae bacterium]